MAQQTQEQIDALIQFIEEAEDPETISNETVADVLNFFNEKFKSGNLSIAELTSSINRLQVVLSELQEALNGKASLDSDTGKLDYLLAPTMLFDSMGFDLNNVNNPPAPIQYLPQAGHTVFDPSTGKIVYYKTSSSTVTRDPDRRLIYGNKLTGLLYQWKGREMRQVGGDSGDSSSSIVTITEDENYVNINIIDNTPSIAVNAPETLYMGGSTKTVTFKVSGQRLRGNINIGVNGEGFSLSHTNLVPDNGIVEETVVTLTYQGNSSANATISISSSGATPHTLNAVYTEQQIPTILVAEDAIAFKAGAGSSHQRTLAVQGVNLTAGIAADISGTDAAKFNVSPASISQSGGSASGSLTITYSPVAGDSGTHTATLTLSSNGATDNKVITLNGAVSALTVSESSMTFSTDQGVAVTDTFTVAGSNLREAVTIAASGTGFSVSPSTIDNINNGSVSSTTITVTYEPTASGSHTGTITIQSSGVSKTISVAGTATAAVVVDENGRFTKKNSDNKNIYYQVIKENDVWTNKVQLVYYKTNITGSDNHTYSGDVHIPETVQAVLEGVLTTFTVTRVAENAFRNIKNNPTRIFLPNTILDIDAGSVFYNSSGITEVHIPSAQNPNFATHGWAAQYAPMFYGCSRLTEIVIPDNVTSLMADTFAVCTSLAKITFGKKMITFTNALGGSLTALRTLICRGMDPIPTPNGGNINTTYSIPISVSGGYDANQEHVEGTLTVYVPDGYKEAYKEKYDNSYGKYPWAPFESEGRLKEMIEYPSND